MVIVSSKYFKDEVWLTVTVGENVGTTVVSFIGDLGEYEIYG